MSARDDFSHDEAMEVAAFLADKGAPRPAPAEGERCVPVSALLALRDRIESSAHQDQEGAVILHTLTVDVPQWIDDLVNETEAR